MLFLVAQLERDILAERVKNGLANAKAKGVHIGRVKTRDSDLIRKLRASGLTFKDCARIANCSTGAVGAEMRALKAKLLAEKLSKKSFEDSLPKLETEVSMIFNSGGDIHQGHLYDPGEQNDAIKLELEAF
jgi:hypothetical protein